MEGSGNKDERGREMESQSDRLKLLFYLLEGLNSAKRLQNLKAVKSYNK